MSVSTVRIIVSLVLMAHGLGHALTALPVYGLRLSETHSADSWLLSKVLRKGLSSGFCVIVNLLAMVTFVAAGLALADWGLARDSWEGLAVTGSVFSLLGLALFWNGFPFLVPNKVGALFVDILALVAILWLRWPPGLFGP